MLGYHGGSLSCEPSVLDPRRRGAVEWVAAAKRAAVMRYSCAARHLDGNQGNAIETAAHGDASSPFQHWRALR
jgi:hypothetical protein